MVSQIYTLDPNSEDAVMVSQIYTVDPNSEDAVMVSQILTMLNIEDLRMP